MPKSEFAQGTAELIRAYMKVRAPPRRPAPPGVFVGAEEGTSPYRTYRFLVAWLDYRFRAGRYVPPTYDSTRHMFYVLKRLGLIEYVRRATLTGPNISRFRMTHSPSIYRLVASAINDPAWRDPKLAYLARFSTNPAYRARWERIKTIPRFFLTPEDEDEVRTFVLRNNL